MNDDLRSPSNGRPMNVLVVDDDDGFRVVMQRRLTASRHQVECVPNGEAALERLAARAFDVVGESRAIRAVLEMTKQIAPTEGRVVILGESGTGKGVLARAIHALSRRRTKPFVDVHCGAVADHLLESELFGHERGAFTG